MADVFNKAKRSEVMASVRGKGNRSTEWKLRARLISSGISGWRMHATEVPGKPDIIFPNEKVAIFLDGCFWHGCKKCRTIPESNHDFWKKKIEGNRKRDRETVRKLGKAGWLVLRFWEHQIKRGPSKCMDAIFKALGKAKVTHGIPDL
jgi:DNA mismatch endonuclease, patch repair protein